MYDEDLSGTETITHFSRLGFLGLGLVARLGSFPAKSQLEDTDDVRYPSLSCTVMSESNVQPTQSLSEWLISRLTAHYETSDAPTTDLHASFEAAFAANAEFVVNHSPVSRDAYKKRLEERLLVASSSVEWKDVMEIPEEGDSGTSQKVRIGTQRTVFDSDPGDAIVWYRRGLLGHYSLFAA